MTQKLICKKIVSMALEKFPDNSMGFVSALFLNKCQTQIDR